MEVFRLTKAKYSEKLSGKGAARFGNRWNSKGVEMIYTSQSRALAMSEVLVHISLNQLPKDFKMICINIPDNISIQSIANNQLPKLWYKTPNGIITQKMGDEFIHKNNYCVLKVPSAVVYGDFNFLINPYHKDFEYIKIKSVSDFPIDDKFFN